MPIIGMTSPFRAPATADFPNVQLNGGTINETVFVIQAQIGFRFTDDGLVEETSGPSAGTGATFAPWWIPAPVADIGDTFEIRATVTAGITPQATGGGGTAPVNVWLPLSADVWWGNESTAPFGSWNSTLLVEIRDVATQTVQDSGTYTINLDIL